MTRYIGMITKRVGESLPFFTYYILNTQPYLLREIYRNAPSSAVFASVFSSRYLMMIGA